MRMFQIRVRGVVASASTSTIWFRFGERVWILKTPLAIKLFSERYGYWPHRSFLGFRWGWKNG